MGTTQSEAADVVSQQSDTDETTKLGLLDDTNPSGTIGANEHAFAWPSGRPQRAGPNLESSTCLLSVRSGCLRNRLDSFGAVESWVVTRTKAAVTLHHSPLHFFSFYYQITQYVTWKPDLYDGNVSEHLAGA